VEYLAQRFLATPLLEPPMHGLVVRVAPAGACATGRQC
jgi:hypothetical protein